MLAKRRVIASFLCSTHFLTQMSLKYQALKNHELTVMEKLLSSISIFYSSGNLTLSQRNLHNSINQRNRQWLDADSSDTQAHNPSL